MPAGTWRCCGRLTDLRDLGADLKILGFSKAELGAALRGSALWRLTDEDAVPELPEAPVAIWATSGSSAPIALPAAIVRCPDRPAIDQPRYTQSHGQRSALLAWPTSRTGAADRGLGDTWRKGEVLNDDRADGARPGRSFLAPSPMSGMRPFTQRKSFVRACAPRVFPSVPRFSGPSRASSSAAAIITGSMSLLVWGAQQGQLDRRPQADDALADRRQGRF